MNKKKKVIIGVLAVILVAAVGYAIFSDKLTISGTATAEGALDLNYNCVKDEENSTGTGECSVKGNTVTTTSNLSKPNDTVMFDVTVTNDGTIPAVLKTVDSPNNMNQDIDGSGDAIYLDASTALSAYYGIMKDDDSYIGDSAAEAANITINPGEEITIKIVHGWSPQEVQPELPDDGASINYNVTFGFEQITS